MAVPCAPTKRRWARVALATMIATVALVAVLAWFAPYLYVEIWPRFHPSNPVLPGPAKVTKGRMVDDYFVVEDLGAGTYAIGEPRYYQANYAYLIVGQKRALLFDAGSGERDMAKIAVTLTKLPVTVLPSHLHYDHVGGLRFFERVALVDRPDTRAETVDGRFTPGRYEFLGMFDDLTAPSVRVDKWIKPGGVIDLGGRVLTLLATPGHTPQSVSLYDAGAHRLFTGDFIYPTMLYAFLPGASLSSYRETASRLLASLPSETVLWAGHCCRRDKGYAAPWLTMTDLKDLQTALVRLDAGQSKSEGFFPRRTPVNGQMTLGTGLPFNNR